MGDRPGLRRDERTRFELPVEHDDYPSENYMSRLASVALMTIVSLLPVVSAVAQVCVGTASFASGPARVGVGLDFAKDAKQYGAQIAVGKPAGPFAAGSVAMVDIDEIDESATVLGIDLGYSLNVAGKGSLGICPVVGFSHATADVDEGGFSIDLTSRTLRAGFAIGGVSSSSPTFKFIPSAGLAYVNEKAKTEDAFEFEQSEDFGVITVAAGLVFNDRVTVRPNLAFPVGLDDSDPTFGVGISLNFGTPTAAR